MTNQSDVIWIVLVKLFHLTLAIVQICTVEPTFGKDPLKYGDKDPGLL